MCIIANQLSILYLKLKVCNIMICIYTLCKYTVYNYYPYGWFTIFFSRIILQNFKTRNRIKLYIYYPYIFSHKYNFYYT